MYFLVTVYIACLVPCEVGKKLVVRKKMHVAIDRAKKECILTVPGEPEERAKLQPGINGFAFCTFRDGSISLFLAAKLKDTSKNKQKAPATKKMPAASAKKRSNKKTKNEAKPLGDESAEDEGGEESDAMQPEESDAMEEEESDTRKEEDGDDRGEEEPGVKEEKKDRGEQIESHTYEAS